MLAYNCEFDRVERRHTAASLSTEGGLEGGKRVARNDTLSASYFG